VSKLGTFDRFLEANAWIREYWPNAAQTRGEVKEMDQSNSFFSVFESLARKLQYNFMKEKRTREVVTKKKALFHPVDWSELVLTKLGAS
jgi:hypothetical protein